MQVALTAEEMEVVKKIVGNDGLRRAVFTCEECKHYHQHYVKGTPENIAPYVEAGSGHCSTRKLVRKSTKACNRFEPKEA